MILTCPECATRYQTDASLFTPDGRKVRCAKCGHVWFQAPPAPDIEAEIAHADAPPQDAPGALPADAGASQAVSPGHAEAALHEGPRVPWFERLALGVGWAALVGIVLVIGWSALKYRQNVASLWPQSSSLYAAVGMPVNTRGIKIETGDRYAHFVTEDGQNVLVITGELVNITSHELNVPPIRVSLTDEDKRELYHWSFAPGVATLHAGQSAPFRTRLPSPPPTARHIDIRFSERSN